MGSIQFRLLGPIEVVQDGKAANPTTAQQRCVLALLLLDLGRVVPAERLIAALWPVDPPVSAQNTVRVYVTRLRRLFAADPSVRLETIGRGWRLTCDRNRVDLYRFRELAARAHGQGAPDARDLLTEALGLWRGPALADAASEHWRESHCAGLEEERLAAIEDRIALDIDSGAAPAVVPELSVLIAEHPTRERLTRLQMSALHDCGRTAEAIVLYHRTRTVLREDLGVDPGSELQSEFQRLLGAPATRRVRDMVDPIPRQLPGDLAAFVGRADALSHLDELLDDEGTFLVALDGLPGVGKTTLAVHWAHRVGDRFPDGTLYANLRGFSSSGPRDPAEILQEFLHALGVPASRVPTGLDARAAHFRSTLSGRRILLVLDNARDEAQVRPLLPSTPGCGVVVTSRHQLTGLSARQGALRLRIDVVEQSEALDLLAKRLGARRVHREPEAASRIVNGCAGLPLALAIVAARADESNDFALASVAAELETAKSALDTFESLDTSADLRTVFSWSYNALSANAARLLRLLGLHWGPDFTVEAAASLAASPVQDTRRLVRELCRTRLLGEHRPGRFGFHDLLAAYAAELAATQETEAARREATRRLLDHYLQGVHTAAELLGRHRRHDPVEPSAPGAIGVDHGDLDHAMHWCATELAVLTTSVSAAHARGFDAHAHQIAHRLMPYLRKQGLGTPWLETTQLAAQAATRTGDPRAQANAHFGLAAAQIWYGDSETARTHLTEALRHYEALADHQGQANIHTMLCKLASAEEDFAAALSHATDALEWYRRAGAGWGEARTLNNIGYCHARLGRPRLALEFCEEAIAVFSGVDDPPGMAGALESLGAAHALDGRHDRAIDAHRRSIDMALKHGEKQIAAAALVSLGDSHLALDEREATIQVWEEALVLLEDIRDPNAETVRAKLAALSA
jgi:DNA-binding SARP family transcriptional activator/Tfp pilus assembly protein PilF